MKKNETVNNVTEDVATATENALPSDIVAEQPSAPVVINGQITNTYIGFDENHSFILALNLETTAGNVNGWGKILTDKNAFSTLNKLLETVGVSDISQIKGSYVRIIVYNNTVVGIANIMKNIEFTLADNDFVSNAEPNEDGESNAN